MDKQTQATMFSSKSPNWRTPTPFYNKLDDLYHFTLDPASDGVNNKCAKFFTEADDGLAQSWEGEIVFLNPPYGRGLKHWVRKAYDEGCKPNTTVVVLMPARTDTKFFHDYCMKARKIYFVKGRLKFLDENGNVLLPAPFPSMVVVFDGPDQTPDITAMER